MNAKFKDVPVEEDTRVLRREVVTVGGREVLHEIWTWDGVRGETIVFVSKEVGGLRDTELEAIVRQSNMVELGSQITIKRSDSGFTFASFNFRA
jgi:hypothetical protein